MAWQNEMTLIVRHLVNDLDSSEYTFIDSRLEEAVLVSAQLASVEIDFENTYTIDADSLTLSPDPTDSSNKDDSFINLVCLRTARMLIGSELKRYDEAVTQYKLNGVVGQAILGPYSPGSDSVARTHLSHRSGWFE